MFDELTFAAFVFVGFAAIALTAIFLPVLVIPVGSVLGMVICRAAESSDDESVDDDE